MHIYIFKNIILTGSYSKLTYYFPNVHCCNLRLLLINTMSFIILFCLQSDGRKIISRISCCRNNADYASTTREDNNHKPVTVNK